MLIPRQAVPELIVDTLAHGRFNLATAQPAPGSPTTC